MNLLKKNQYLKNKINPSNLIYKYNTEGRSPKDSNNLQNLIDLFINLKDGNIDPKKVLKNQINFKSGLSQINIY